MNPPHPHSPVQRALQHGIIPRPAFKRWLTRLTSEASERSTYVLLSTLALILLFWRWRPLGGMIWQIKKPLGDALMYGGSASGLLLVLVPAFLINQFNLFGLRHVWKQFRAAA